MITAQSISSISDLRFKTKEVIKKALKSPVFLFSHNTPKGVLLSYESYDQLISRLEDYYDSKKAEELETQDKKNSKWVLQKDIDALFSSK